MRSNAILSLYLLFCFVLGVARLPAQTGDLPEKIDPDFWIRVRNGGQAECLIVLTEQADVRDAERFRRKTDKGRYVYETLLAAAERTQPPVRQVIRSAGAPVQSFWIINAIWTIADADLALQLAEMPAIARVEDNPTISLRLPTPESDPTLSYAPADRTLTPASWGLTKINADDVWNLDYTGAGVVVGGQDTGYEWEHPALKEKYRGWNGSSANHNYNWHDAIHSLINGGSNSCGLNLDHPCDDDNHGTHTMGTMVGAASMSNVVGVAPDAQWIGCRNMEEGDGTPATYIECFEWFAAPTNLANNNPDPAMAPHVINNSWGCPASEGCNSGNFATMETVINNLQSAGILVVTSAGNDGPNCSTIYNPPSIFLSSFAVGATQNQSNDLIAGFSSRGPVVVFGNHKKPDICAPGVSINSCIGRDNNPSTYTYAGNWSGTSMAGPHVAGVAALIMSARPDLIGQVATLKNLMTTTAVPRYATAPFCGTDNSGSLPNNVYGYGRIDALAAVNAALALPVELAYFTVEPKGGAALLRWGTATEADCAGFELQRSTDAIHWELVGRITCAGNSLIPRVYTFTDADPGTGLRYYRLKQLDYSGAFAYSHIVSARFGAAGVRLRVAPHPAQQQVFFEVMGAATGEAWRLSIFAADGREIQTATLSDILTLTLPGLPRGIYSVLLRDGQGRIAAVERMWW